ncbi:MAG: HAD family hydrolase [Gammaproteobacteria bacterium]|nr:MAG: HAD family hydrolase [Gammaproteobacteria bacterium]
MKYRGIVFDKDGTLLDFNRTWLPIYLYAAREFAGGEEKLAESLLTEHGYQAQAGRFVGGSLLAAGNNWQIAEQWALQLGKPERVDEISLRLNEIFRERGAIEATPVDRLADTLAQLKQSGLRLGVATADSHQGILNTLQSFGVLDHFDFLAGYDSGHGIKPEAGMVLAFCQQMQFAAEDVVVVGDNRHDIEMGRNAGAGLCVGVLTGTSTRDELEDIADIVFDDISELPAAL